MKYRAQSCFCKKKHRTKADVVRCVELDRQILLKTSILGGFMPKISTSGGQNVVCSVSKFKSILGLFLFVLSLSGLLGCNTLHKLTSSQQTQDPIPSLPDQYVVNGITINDFQTISVRTLDSMISVKAGNRSLNKYEFKVIDGGVELGHQVTINPNQTITYKTPFVPVAPKGTSYEITSTKNDHSLY